MQYAIIKSGESRSFPDGDPFLTGALREGEAEITLYCKVSPEPDRAKAAVLVELGHECLGEHAEEDAGNLLGFARYRNGGDPPTNLIELVRQPSTDVTAVDAARLLFEGAGFSVVVCSDQPGRVIDRLVRPKYNAALRLLDEGLATQKDIDLTCRLGLGYSDGPIERVIRGGLADHYEVTKTLFETFGTPGFAPASRAVIAARKMR